MHARLLLLVICSNCGHSRGAVGRPEATLSASAEAQSAFRGLRAAWFSGSSSDKRKLEPALRSFLARFPSDEQSDAVKVLVAFDCVSRGLLPEARALIAEVREHEGAVSDFAEVVRAYALLRESKADAAWYVLEPLSGKIVDTDERLVFSELRLRAAASAHRYARALLSAQELLAEAPAETQGAFQDLVRELFRTAPKVDLVASLASMEQREPGVDAPSRARQWLTKMLREQLVAIAVREKDAALARRLLDSAPAALRASASGAALLGIAGGGRVSPLILGRSVGVALSLGSAETRRRSASLVLGLVRGLGLPQALSEPGAVHLISQDDGGSSAGTEEALRALTAQGAAILVAGVDPPSAEIAARFAEENAIPVVLTEPAASIGEPLHDAFVIGESGASEQAAIDAELSRRGLLRVARVGRLGEACDVPLESAGNARFSVEQWRSERIGALLVLGSAACAEDVARELHSLAFEPELVLGLEAAEFVYASDAPRARFAVGAGAFPSAVRLDAAANSALPPHDWYEALGHDAALLAKAALDGFPDRRVDDGRAVRELHLLAARAFGAAQATLWTSDARGFAGAHALPRTLKIVSPNSQPSRMP